MSVRSEIKVLLRPHTIELLDWFRHSQGMEPPDVIERAFAMFIKANPDLFEGAPALSGIERDKRRECLVASVHQQHQGVCAG